MSAPGRSVGLVLPCLVLAAAVVHALAWDFVSDDTFIALRYAQNLLHGHGLVFNPGERVEGFSSVVMVLTVACLGALGIDLLAAARGLSLVASLGAAALAYAMVRTSGASKWAALSAPVVLAACAASACWALAGLDAPLFGATVLLAAIATRWLVQGGAVWPAWLALGLMAWTRPEGPLVAVVLLLVGWVMAAPAQRRRVRMTVLLVAGCIAGLFLLRLAYYGEWLPNTYYAKMGAPSAALLASGVTYLTDCGRDLGGAPLFLLPFVAACWRRDAAWWACAAAAATLAACIVVEGGDGLPMYRFLVPCGPVWAVLVAFLVADGVRRVGSGRWGLPWLLGLGVVATALATPSAESLHYLRYKGQKDFEVPAWTAVGEWLRANAPAGASVACVPIGAVAYYSGLPVIDMLGLTDKHIAHVRMPTGVGWAGHEKRDGKYVLSRRPTFLLLGNVRVLDRALSINDPEFVRVQHPAVEAREGDVYGNELVQNYVPQVANLGGGLFLHYLRRKT